MKRQRSESPWEPYIYTYIHLRGTNISAVVGLFNGMSSHIYIYIYVNIDQPLPWFSDGCPQSNQLLLFDVHSWTCFCQKRKTWWKGKRQGSWAVERKQRVSRGITWGAVIGVDSARTLNGFCSSVCFPEYIVSSMWFMCLLHCQDKPDEGLPVAYQYIYSMFIFNPKSLKAL